MAKFHKETLHGYERRLVKIGAELKRLGNAPVCLRAWWRRLRRL